MYYIKLILLRNNIIGMQYANIYLYLKLYTIKLYMEYLYVTPML